MLRAIPAISMAVLFPVVASAQQAGVLVEAQVAAQKSAAPIERAFVEPYVGGEHGGLWGFVYGEKEYLSAVAGPDFDVFKKGDTSVDIGLAAGIERFREDGSYRSALRYAWSLTFEGSKGKAEFYYENGTTHSHWIQAEATVHVGPALDVGIFHQTDDGTGPRAIVSIPRTPLKIWGGPMFKPGGTVWLAALDVALGR